MTWKWCLVVWRKKGPNQWSCFFSLCGKNLPTLGIGHKGIQRKLNGENPDPQTLAYLPIKGKGYTSIMTCPRSSRSPLTSLTISVEYIEDATSSCITLTAMRLLTLLFSPPYIHIILGRSQGGSGRLEIWGTKHIPLSFKDRVTYKECLHY